jgi:hypothetical protein
MPKRSNEFQRLIQHIHEQIVPTGASVRESVELQERGSGSRREVGVLIECPLIDSITRIAVECRDRARSGDVEWIDALIGKYRDLPVHQIIAVSSKVFTRGAVAKAASSDPRIELRSLRQALDADWPAELTRVGMATIGTTVSVERIRILTDPPWSSAQPPTHVTSDAKEQTFPEYFQDCIKLAHPELSRAFMKASQEVVKTVEDLKKGRYRGKFVVTAKNPTTFQSATGGQHRFVSMTCHAVVGATVVDVPVERRLYGAAQVGVSSGMVRRNDGTEFRLTAVQVPGKDVSPYVERVETNQRKPRPRSNG